MLHIAHAVANAPGAGHDRVAIVRQPHLTTVIVADGSSGTSGAAEAAELTIREVTALVTSSSASGLLDWCTILEHTDRAVTAGRGQCAVAIAGIARGTVTGASVGDCCVWLLTYDGINDLTESQFRKPLLGAGRSVPVGFGTSLGGTLLVASDGLWKYVQRNRIAAIAREPRLETAVQRLVETCRLPSGDLQDDVSVVLCRDETA
jgi:serine/threonine protein phosphatase PrpC